MHMTHVKTSSYFRYVHPYTEDHNKILFQSRLNDDERGMHHSMPSYNILQHCTQSSPLRCIL